MPNLGPTELIIILVIVLLLFGYKKLPDAARSIGKSMRVFKAETKAMKEDDTTAAASPTPAPTDHVQTPVTPPPALPTQPSSVEQQRADAQRFLDSTAGTTPAAPQAAAEPPSTQR